MKIRIRRYNAEKVEPNYWQEYELPEKIKGSTMMQILDFIADNLDGSLAYYRHSSCMHGICGRCTLKVNGKVKLACVFVPVEELVILEPFNDKVCRDLVCY